MIFSMVSDKEFIEKYDELRRHFLNIVELPDSLINLLIVSIHRNEGVLPAPKLREFRSISDEDIKALEFAYREVFDDSL